MKRVIDWLEKNWFWVMVLVLAAVFLSKNDARYLEKIEPGIMMEEPMMADMVGVESRSSLPPVFNEGISDSAERLVIEDTSVSLLVDDVEVGASDVQKIAEEVGGFLVSRSIDSPEGAASGTVVVRVPSNRRDEVMDRYADLAVRVVSENVRGTDVTADYEDIDAKLAVVLRTKTKLESLLDQATEVNEILQVQRELNNLQFQIDSLQGRKDYLADAANLTKITVYLSTDELALPYTPDEVWRPRVVFKEAVRSLIETVRDFGSGLIWLVVFLPVWGGLLLIVWLWKKWRRM